jgi:hypothetical protein
MLSWEQTHLSPLADPLPASNHAAPRSVPWLPSREDAAPRQSQQSLRPARRKRSRRNNFTKIFVRFFQKIRYQTLECRRAEYMDMQL